MKKLDWAWAKRVMRRSYGQRVAIPKPFSEPNLVRWAMEIDRKMWYLGKPSREVWERFKEKYFTAAEGILFSWWEFDRESLVIRGEIGSGGPREIRERDIHLGNIHHPWLAGIYHPYSEHSFGGCVKESCRVVRVKTGLGEFKSFIPSRVYRDHLSGWEKEYKERFRSNAAYEALLRQKAMLHTGTTLASLGIPVVGEGLRGERRTINFQRVTFNEVTGRMNLTEAE